MLHLGRLSQYPEVTCNSQRFLHTCVKCQVHIKDKLQPYK
ncbi:12511_t:CDS:2 [Entrophospora sp. SA101]|nr:12511_t:CDS:2 [Entrophospora sp. SA101]